ncbi:MAG TPA: glycosyltransferase family 2 protein [Syntrophales bacterium]|nr:glycosyltransferase family 2 protein [Syntrophales bacterium]
MMHEAANPLVSVAILTWNRRRYVLKAIDSVLRQPYRPIEVVVVDSASNDGTVKAVRTTYPEVRVIRLNRNLGAVEGRNIALASCRGDILFSLDDDARILPTTLAFCVERLLTDESLGVIACRVIESGSDPDLKEGHTFFFPEGGFAVKREVIDKVGYFPHDFFRQAESTDMTLRIVEAGYSVLLYNKAVIYHERALINRDEKLYMFYGCRNEIFTVIRRYPLAIMPLACLWKIFVWNVTGAEKHALRFTLKGSIAGMVRLPRLLMQREPVSVQTIKKLMRLKKSFR